MTNLDYETALGFVISLRPRMAVEDADTATRRLLRLAVPDPLEVEYDRQDWPTVALMLPAVMDYVYAGKKIQAIKELRVTTRCSLLEAKEAIESPEVVAYLPVGGWGS